MKYIMMKLYKPLCLILLSFCKVSALIAMNSVEPIDFSEFGKKAYLVHVTSVLLHDSTAIGGGLTNNKVIPHDKAMRPRATFHTCSGGMVPEEYMVSVSNFFGLPLHSPVKDHNKTPYAYLEPFEAFQGECIGGQLQDCFIFDRHHYGKNAIIILPVTDLHKFRQGNSNFEGQVVSYDPQTASLRETVNTILEQKQAWRITFEGKPGGQSYDYPIIKINDTEIDANLLNEHFKNLTLYQGNHNHSRFRILESLLGYLNKPFVHFYLKPDSPLSKTLMPSVEATVVRSLVDYQFNKLGEEIQGLSMEKREAFSVWQEETSHWIDLYFRLLKFVEEKKAFNKPETFAQLIAARGQEDMLESISAGLPVLEKHLSIGDPDDLGLSLYVPAYWDSLSHMPVGDIQEALSYAGKQHQTWDKRPVVASYLFFKKIFRNPLQSPEDINPIFISAFAKSAGELSWIRPSSSALDKGAVEFFRNEIFDLFGNPETEQQLFALMNIPRVKSALSILLYAPSWNEKEVLSIKDILGIAPGTQQLYGDQTAYTKCAAFVRPSLLKVPVKSFKEAYGLNACFCGFLKALSMTPLNTNGIRGDIMGKIKLSAYQEAEPYFNVIQSGRYGSLNEIFAFYDLQTEFRQAYPTDEDFWNVPADWTGSAPSFESVLNTLMEKKTIK